ncbi:hypothetical protein LP420_29440 [Massilia sp. B-10]|nr:hypothetical protein LP420_29440 [Massilia sp. B-10]UUZ53028.1 hypothetical protein LP419_28985 [Massilia sp. H-1]
MALMMLTQRLPDDQQLRERGRLCRRPGRPHDRIDPPHLARPAPVDARLRPGRRPRMAEPRIRKAERHILRLQFE